MAVKIIPNKIQCDNCLAMLEYNIDDIQERREIKTEFVGNKYPHRVIYYNALKRYIICPNCNKEITIKSHKLLG